MSGVSRWGLSPLDAPAHAIDEGADHPYGVYVARCGPQLLMATALHDNPTRRLCPSCARWIAR